VGRGLFCELGKGDVDFPAILAELKRMNYNGWIVVEQDVLPGMGSPKESAQRNRNIRRSDTSERMTRIWRMLADSYPRQSAQSASSAFHSILAS
jgi:sugar phosphate isomerase/epimerase